MSMPDDVFSQAKKRAFCEKRRPSFVIFTDDENRSSLLIYNSICFGVLMECETNDCIFLPFQ